MYITICIERKITLNPLIITNYLIILPSLIINVSIKGWSYWSYKLYEYIIVVINDKEPLSF